MSFWISF